MKLSVIIPVFNEEKTIANVLKKINSVYLNNNIKKEIIVVDDASKDSTVTKIKNQKLRIKNLRLILHSMNQGKGAAVRTGIKKASGDYILIQDADLEYNPKDIPKLLKPILEDKARVVYGTRLKRLPNFSRDERNFRFFLHYVGNRGLSLITSVLYGQWITDMETCYKLFPKKAVESMSLDSKRFDFEPEITAKLLKKGYRIIEVPIATNPRGYDEGKKLNTFRDGIKALLTLLKYRLRD